MVRMPNFKPDRELETEEFIYSEHDMEDVLEGSAGDCCELAKDSWIKSVEDQIPSINNLNREYVAYTLDPSNLDCRNFLDLLKKLNQMRPGSFATASVNKIIGRYFRIDQMKTSLLSSVATRIDDELALTAVLPPAPAPGPVWSLFLFWVKYFNIRTSIH